MDDSKALLQLITDSGAAHLQTLANAVVIPFARPGNAGCRDGGSLMLLPAGQPPPLEDHTFFDDFKLTTPSERLHKSRTIHEPTWPFNTCSCGQ
jgi:hypothetical protein